MGKKRKNIRRAAPLYLFWTVWRERNRVPLITRSFLHTDRRDLSSITFGLGPTWRVGIQTGLCWIFNLDGV